MARQSISLSLCFGILLLASSAVAQETDESAVVGPEMPKPTEHHDFLKRLVGDWTSEMKCEMGPNQPIIECEGGMKAHMLGGFWLINEISSEMAGVEMKGLQTIGFDSSKKKYVGTWVDVSSDFIWHYVGEVDKSGNKLVLQAEGPNIMTGEGTLMYRDAFEFKSDDEIFMTSSMQMEDGSWYVFMKGVVKRNK